MRHLIQKQLRQGWLKIAGIALLLIFTMIVLKLGYSTNESGFASAGDPESKYYRPAKTLWDWLQLLIVPAMLALGALWFNTQQNRIQRRHSREQHEVDARLTEQRRQADQELAADQQREDNLQGYLDRMSELLFEKRLRSSQEGDETQQVARARTLMILRRLDPERKAVLVKFLSDANLLERQHAIIKLAGADLCDALLQGSDLSGAELRGAKFGSADLHGANLKGVDLGNANLHRANLSWADLSGADLSGANLSGADLSEANLSGADLSGATLNGVDLRGADLHGALLTQANLPKADLREADLRGVNLRGVNLRGANLSDAIVTAGQLSKVKALDETILPDGSKHTSKVGA